MEKLNMENTLTVQGVVVSKIPCHKERYVRAKRENKNIEEVPLRYGSVRMMVNLVKLNGKVFYINRKPTNKKEVQEERLVLEIGYRYDYKNYPDQEVISKDYEVINNINVDDYSEIEISHNFISKNHNMTLINAGSNKVVRTYFLKCWADDIIKVSQPVLKGNNKKKIKPISVLRNYVKDKELILNK